MDKLRLSKAGKGAAATAKRELQAQDVELLTRYQAALAQFRQRKRARGAAEGATMSRLKDFTSRLREQRKGGSTAVAGMEADGGAVSEAAAGQEADDGDKGYAGRVNRNIDHRAYMPAAWRVRLLHAASCNVRGACAPAWC